MPRTIKECEQSIKLSWHSSKSWQPLANHEGYYYQKKETSYGQVRQSWILLYSDTSYGRSEKKIENEVSKSLKRLEKGLKTPLKTTYRSQAWAKRGLRNWYQGLSDKEKTYHSLGEIEVKEIKKYGRGRRKADTPPKALSIK